MKSYWLESTSANAYPRLEADLQADVCIVGAGIVGVTLAYLLHKQGLNVVILEKDSVLSSTTANTTAKITSQHGLFYTYLINSFSKDFAKKYLYSNENAISSIMHIIQSEKIECDLEIQDSYVYSCLEKDRQKLILEAQNVKSLGFEATFCENIPLPFKTIGAVKFPNQAQFHPRKYTLSLLNLIPQNCIYENSKVYDIKPNNKTYKVLTTAGTVSAKYVAITTHYPIINFPGLYFLKMYQDTSYIIGVDVKEELFPGMYISENEPVTSFRTIPFQNKRLLLLGGSGHKTGSSNIDLYNSYKNLENYVKKLYPKSEILYRWHTQDCISLDKIPYIGEYSNLMPNVFVATGFKKWGMTTSYVAAKIILDKIIGISNPYDKIYSSTRLHPLKNKDELGNMIAQTSYSLIFNKMSTPIEKYENLEIGTGGVVDYHGKKLGIYKKSKNEIFAVKPYCSHLGCELSWNNLEKTWDCPCHGSRYDYKGNLLNEPSKKGLEIVNLE